MNAENFQEERRRGNGVKRKRAAEMNLPDLKASSPSLMFRLENGSVGRPNSVNYATMRNSCNEGSCVITLPDQNVLYKSDEKVSIR